MVRRWLRGILAILVLLPVTGCGGLGQADDFDPDLDRRTGDPAYSVAPRYNDGLAWAHALSAKQLSVAQLKTVKLSAWSYAERCTAAEREAINSVYLQSYEVCSQYQLQYYKVKEDAQSRCSASGLGGVFAEAELNVLCVGAMP